MAMIELNFAEICRCCKLMETGMISIFDELPIYPPVKDMLNTIVNLNAEENDGLPSLVCTLCLNNIQGTYTFIMQLIRTDAQLRQILLERMVKTEVLPQDEIDSLAVADLDESMENVYVYHGSADNSSKISDFDVKPKIEEANIVESHQEQLNGVLPLTAMTITKEESSDNVDAVENCDELAYPLSEDMEELVDADDMGVDENWQDTDPLKVESNLGAEEDVEKPQRTKSELADKLRYKCKLCSFISVHIKSLRRHLLAHCKNKPFICSKCNGTFGRRSQMMRHWRNCSGKIKSPSQQWIPLTVQDLEDSEKIKEYYTVTGSKSSKKRIIKCNLCEFACRHMCRLKEHLIAHSKDEPFTCSKCNGTFARRSDMMHHRRKCSGEMLIHGARHRRNPSQWWIPLTPQDLKDPEKIKDYYIVIGGDKRNNDGDSLEVQSADDRGVDVEIAEICPQRPTTPLKDSKQSKFKCKLCDCACRHMSHLREHLITHFKDQPFTCSKCNGTFARRHVMMRHWRKCTGEIPRQAHGARNRRNSSQRSIPLTLEDLKDPEKIKEYYIVTGGDTRSNDGDSLEVQRADDRGDDVEIAEICPKRPTTPLKDSKPSKYKCKLCECACRHMSHLKEHLITHFKDPPFTCSKCNGTFCRRYEMMRHWRKCSGEIASQAHGARNRRNSSQQCIPLTLQDLKDPEKFKEYYIVTGGDSLEVHRADDRGDE